jgi:hypothetical protein
MMESMKKTAFWDVILCSLEVEQRFRGEYCLHHQGDDGRSKHLLTVSLLL